ncbi:MAG TPA: VWA domain-containing protein [Dehalococcoidia bacterium]|nr:VWA domain-containing protein [Dehalococcoidia bacterium]
MMADEERAFERRLADEERGREVERRLAEMAERGRLFERRLSEIEQGRRAVPSTRLVPQPPVAGWWLGLTLLRLIPAALSTDERDRIAAWLMAGGLFGEASAGGLLTAIAGVSYLGAVIGMMAAYRITAWGIWLLNQWPPGHRVLALLSKALAPVMMPVVASLAVSARTVAAGWRLFWLAIRTTLRYVGLVIANIVGYIWWGVATPIRFAWLGVATVAPCLWLGVSVVLSYVGLGVSTVLRYAWLGVSTVLRYVWLGTSTAPRYLRLAVSETLRHPMISLGTVLLVMWTARRLGWQVIATVALYIGLGIVLVYLWRAMTTALRYLWLGISTLASYLWLVVSTVLRYVWVGMSTVVRYLWFAVFTVLRYLWLGISTMAGYLWLGLSTVLRYIWLGVETVAGYIWLGVATVARYLWLGVSTVLRYLWLAISTMARYLWLGLSTVLRYIWLGVATMARYVWLGVSTVLRYVWLSVSTVMRYLWLGVSTVASYLWLVVSTVLRYLWLGVSTVAHYLWLGLSTLAGALTSMVALPLRYLWRGVRAIVGYLWLGPLTIVHYLRIGAEGVVAALKKAVGVPWSYLWLGVTTIFVLLRLGARAAGLAVWGGLLFLGRAVRFMVRAPWITYATLSDLWETMVGPRQSQLGVYTMSDFTLTRERLLALVATLWLFGVAAVIVWGLVKPPPTVVVTHWASGHMARPALLPAFSDEFNKANHLTQSGKRIVVRFHGYGSQEQADDLVSRISKGIALDPKVPDPVIVTPSADHWLVYVNHAVGRAVVDLTKSKSIARTYVGIVTFRDMAECLGWPNREIGYADIVALVTDPRGWSKYPCSKIEWGQQPLMAYTDPATSTTGRSVLFTLYSIAAGKPAERLTVADITDPKVVAYVKEFQSAVDHYMVGTLPLNSKIFNGPRFGHFFFLPEDNLVGLYNGTEPGTIGNETKRQPISRPMVMMYPKEGSSANANSAGIVQAPWVTLEQVEAAERWVSFLREEGQQRRFMNEGFRSPTGLPNADPISGRWGLDPAKPTTIVNPDRVDPSAATAILQSWDDVKKPGVVTFVADVSASMLGGKLTQAKEGLVRAVDGMAKNNLVGLLTFDDTIRTRVEVAPLLENRFKIADAIQAMRANGNTALYDAIIEGVRMTDAAPGDPDAIRGVVVMTDGQANRGQNLHALVNMVSTDERRIRTCAGFAPETQCVDEFGRAVAKQNIVGTELALSTRHRIHVFFIGLGGDADMEIGRIIAGATGSAYQGATEESLAGILAEFGRYF